MLRPAVVIPVLTSIFAVILLPQTAPPQGAPQKKAAPAPAKSTGPAAMTNRDVIRLVQAKISEDLIVSKIRQSKTRFDLSTDGLIALKEAGVSDGLIAVMMNPAADTPGSSAPPPAPHTPAPPAAVKPAMAPAETGPKPVAATVAARPVGNVRPAGPPRAPENYGVYIEDHGELKSLGRIQTKVQISKFRTLVKSVVPFVREKVDINIPGAHSTSRYEVLRPTFYAYFPASRDVSKFKLLQAKITGQKFDQRTLANSSVLFSTEQNQDEILCDIGPTGVKDLYRITPKEDIPTGEFGFVEGNTGSQSTSNIEIIDVYDFGVDRKEEKLPLAAYLDTLPAAPVDRGFLEWKKEDCQRIVADREGHTGITGSLMGWFKRQYSSLDVYWADAPFAKAFARLEMLDRNLTGDQTVKLASLLLSPDSTKYYIVVSIGGKIGSGKLIGANEGERLMRPFDAALSDERGKDVVPARRLEFMGGYAGLWKVTFDEKSIRGPLLMPGVEALTFEARLNQNLDFKAKFDMPRINSSLSTPQ